MKTSKNIPEVAAQAGHSGDLRSLTQKEFRTCQRLLDLGDRYEKMKHSAIGKVSFTENKSNAIVKTQSTTSIIHSSSIY